MHLVDANVLLYSVNRDAEYHEQSRQWLEDALSGTGTVAFAWIALLAFVRLSTKIGLFPTPLTPAEAMSIVETWLSAPNAVIVEPSRRHAAVLRDLLAQTGTGANLTNDAHLAALAIEHGCRVVTFDHDFARFAGVGRHRPRD